MISRQTLLTNLDMLKLKTIKDNLDQYINSATDKELSHLDFLQQIITEEANEYARRATDRRIYQARFPVTKTIDTFKWSHPTSINRQQIQNFMHLDFIEKNANLIFIGPTGVGKTHLATSIAHHACMNGKTVLFTTAFEMINNLSSAQHNGTFIQQMKKYTRPAVLYIDELGYLPVDKHGADLLFQVISSRYERGSIILTTNRVFKEWPKDIFNNDSTLTTAILDRLLHHAEVSLIEGDSYRMKGE